MKGWFSIGYRALGGHWWPPVALNGPKIVMKFIYPNFSNTRISIGAFSALNLKDLESGARRMGVI